VAKIVEDKDDLANAIALNSAMFNGARIVGPSVAGLAIAVLGEGLCYLLNGISYIAVLGALLAMKFAAVPRGKPVGTTANILGGLKEGCSYAFSLSTTMKFSLAIAFIMGFGIIAQMAATNTIIQTLVDEDKRARVMSLYILSFGGLTPVGSLLAGHIAGIIGTQYTFLLGGVLALAGTALFSLYLPAWRAAAGKIYVEKGII
jgi:predicted MFS family arabinose efflux permease